MKYLISITVLLISISITAQNFADKEYYLVDSLNIDNLPEQDKVLLEIALKKYHSAANDTGKISALNNICESMSHFDWFKYQEFEMKLINNAISKSLSKEEKQFIAYSSANSNNNMGYISHLKGDYSIAITYYEVSLRIFDELKDSIKLPEIHMNLASAYYSIGLIEKALEENNKALLYYERTGNLVGKAMALNNIAGVYIELDDFESSFDFFKKSLKIRESIGDEKGVSSSLINIAGILLTNKKYDEALDYYRKALPLANKTQNTRGEVVIYSGMGETYRNKENLDSAIFYHNKSLKIAKELNLNNDIVTSYNNLGLCEFDKGNYKSAISILENSISLAKKIQSPRAIKFPASILSNAFEKIGDHKKSLEYYKLHIQMRDSINNEETQKAAIRQQTQYEFEKEQIRKENEAKEKARVEAEELKRRDNLEYSLIFLGILLLFGAVLMLGFIKVSPNVAEGLIFFAFLILFEFVLVFVEPYLNEYTGGEPIYTLVANAAIALLIFPLHDVLESRLKRKIVKQ